MHLLANCVINKAHTST